MTNGALPSAASATMSVSAVPATIPPTVAARARAEASVAVVATTAASATSCFVSRTSPSTRPPTSAQPPRASGRSARTTSSIVTIDKTLPCVTSCA